MTTGVLDDRAAQKRALRAAGYRGSKSKRNRHTKDEATYVVNVVRGVKMEQLRQASDQHFPIVTGVIRRKTVCGTDQTPWPCDARRLLDSIPGVNGDPEASEDG